MGAPCSNDPRSSLFLVGAEQQQFLAVSEMLNIARLFAPPPPHLSHAVFNERDVNRKKGNERKYTGKWEKRRSPHYVCCVLFENVDLNQRNQKRSSGKEKVFFLALKKKPNHPCNSRSS